MIKTVSIFIFVLASWGTFSLAQTQAWMWAKKAGNTAEDRGVYTTTDGAGNVIVTGRFHGPTITFGAFTLTNGGYADAFIVKYDSSGNVLWAKGAGGTGFEEGIAVAADIFGNIYLVGDFFSNSITFGTTTIYNNGNVDGFIVKFDANGNVLWADNYGYDENDGIDGITSDGGGNIIICGRFASDSVSFGNVTVYNTPSLNINIYVVKLDPNGNAIWIKSHTAANHAESYGIASDASGNVFVTGKFSSPIIVFGTFTLTNAGSYDTFIVKYDFNGNVMWAKSAGGADIDESYSVAAAPNGNVFITGCFRSPAITFGTTTLTSAGDFDIFIVKYNANGNVAWAIRAGGVLNEEGCDVACDVAGNVFVAGKFRSPVITLGTIPISNLNFESGFIVKFMSNGNSVWAESLNGITNSMGDGVSIDMNGNLYLTGNFGGSYINFGATTLSCSGHLDFFISKNSVCQPSNSSISITRCDSYVSPSGNYIYTTSGTYLDTVPNSLICDSVITINLTINQSPVVTINAQGPTTFCRGDSVLLSASPGLTNYQWYTYGNIIPGATSINHLAKNRGKFKCVAQNASLCSGISNIITVNVPCVPIDPPQQRTNNFSEVEQDLMISPNPGNGIFQITSPKGLLQVFNSFGKLIYKRELNDTDHVIDISGFSDGIYFVKVKTIDEILSRKIILLRQ